VALVERKTRYNFEFFEVVKMHVDKEEVTNITYWLSRKVSNSVEIKWPHFTQTEVYQ